MCRLSTKCLSSVFLRKRPHQVGLHCFYYLAHVVILCKLWEDKLIVEAWKVCNYDASDAGRSFLPYWMFTGGFALSTALVSEDEPSIIFFFFPYVVCGYFVVADAFQVPFPQTTSSCYYFLALILHLISFTTAILKFYQINLVSRKQLDHFAPIKIFKKIDFRGFPRTCFAILNSSDTPLWFHMCARILSIV